MTAGKVKSIEKTEKSSDPSSPAHAFAQRPGVGLSQGAFDAATFPQLAGNLAVQQLFRAGAIQAKLAISQPGDPDEKEADRVADQVMRMVEPTPISSAPSTIQRKCAACEAGGATCPKCEEEKKLRRKERPGHIPQATPAIHSQIAALRGGGQPLPQSVRGFFEPRFGRDFGDVRVHTDSPAAESARAIQARAFTAGQDVVFGAGEYAPENCEGRKLLAHELVHVVQQVHVSAPTGRSVGVQRQVGGSAAPTQDNPPPGPATPLSSPSLIEQKVPAVGGDQIKFESVLLSSDTEFVRYQIEQMIASGGINNTAYFVERLVASPGSDESSLAGSQKQPEDIAKYGSLPGGVPLAPETEDEIRHRMANKERVRRVIPVVQREFKLLRTEAEEFLADFETLANDKMFDALRVSQGRIEGEAKRYGISPAELFSGPELRTTAFPKPQTPADVAQEMRGQQADAARYRAAEKPRQELVKAAIEVRRRRAVVERIEAQLQSVRNPPSGSAFPKPRTALDELKAMRIEEELQKAKLQFNEFVREKQRQFPILAAFMRDGGDLSTLADAKGEALKAALLGQINEKLKNIFDTRENMREGKIRPWDIPFVVAGTRRLMKVDKGTMRARVVDDRYEEKKREKIDEKERLQAISTLSFVLGLLAIIPTPLSPVLGAASAALQVPVALHDLEEYIVQSAASGTDFDKALAISQEDPSLFWLAVELVGTALDLGAAAKALRGIGALKRAVVAGEKGAIKALETEASKLGPKVAQRLVAEAEAARRAAVAEARTAGKAAQVVEEEAIKAGKLAEQTFEHGGHTYQILKDGRIVRCSKLCADLNLLFGDLFERNPHLAEELNKVRALKGKAAAEAAAHLTERMDQIRKAEQMSLEELEKLLDKPEFAKGTPKGDDLRYVRYQRQSGELPFEDWFSKSRGGRLGGPEHQDILADIRKRYGPTTTSEKRVASRFGDAYTPPEGGKKAIYHQVGETNVRGDPIARERRAIDDIRRAVGDDADIIFYPKNKKPPYLVNPDKDPRFAKTWHID